MKYLLLLFLLSIQISPIFSQTFVDQQLKYPTVQEAKSLKDSTLRAEFETKGLAYPPYHILVQVYKSEAELEVWVQSTQGGKYDYFKTYPICDMSGTLGPKRARGDRQVPEGYYTFSYFNPESSYFLSLKVAYPNASDKVLGDSSNLGGNIYLHGACGSLGCIAINDNQIAEVYWLAVLAKSNSNQALPIYIFPTRLTDYKYSLLRSVHNSSDSNWTLWKNLKLGYDKFQESKQLLEFSVNEKGEYVYE